MRSPRNAPRWAAELRLDAHRLRVSLATDVGPARAVNEDAVAIDPSRGVALVIDGSGGAPPGIVGEKIGVAFLDEIARGASVRDALAASGASLDREPYDPLDLQGCGATAVAAAFDRERVTIAHVGDCRAHVIRAGAIRALTRDHSLLNEALDRGLAVDVASWPYRKVLLRALGNGQRPAIDTCEVILEPGDQLVLCTDGVHQALGDAELLATIVAHPNDPARALVDAAILRGGDNAAAIVCAVDGSP